MQLHFRIFTPEHALNFATCFHNYWILRRFPPSSKRQTCSDSQPARIHWVWSILPRGLSQLGREAYHSSQSRAEVKEKVEPSRCAQGQPQCLFHNLQPQNIQRP
jgi:hypothetical protein